MSEPANTTATPAQVLSRVESELRTFWSTPLEPGQAPRTRACTMNLLVVAPTAKLAADWVPIVDEVLLALPARAIVVGVDSTGADTLTASVSAVCTPAAEGGPSVCSERIALGVGGRLCTRASSCIRTLCASDVPTTLVWLGQARPNDMLFARIAEEASRIVSDASQSSLDSLATIVSWMSGRAEADRPGIADLTWTHLGAWQELCARLFDEPRLRHLATRVTRVTVAQASPARARLAPATALFLGWLGTRLGWKVLVRAGNIEVTRSDERALQLNLRAEPDIRSSGEIVSVRLEAEADGIGLKGEIVQEPRSGAAGKWRLDVVQGKETQSLVQVVRLGDYHLAHLLERTLHRPVFDAALAEAIDWAAPLQAELVH